MADFTSYLLGVIHDVQKALQIPEDEQAASNGSLEMLAAIDELRARIAHLELENTIQRGFAEAWRKAVEVIAIILEVDAYDGCDLALNAIVEKIRSIEAENQRLQSEYSIRWSDLPGATLELVESAPEGMRPLMRQWVAEFARLRADGERLSLLVYRWMMHDNDGDPEVSDWPYQDSWDALNLPDTQPERKTKYLEFIAARGK